MKKLLSIFLIIITAINFSAQNVIKYDFKKRVNHVMKDSIYEAFEIIVNKRSIGSPKYLKMGILPLGFAIWDKEKEINPKFDSDDYIWLQKNDYNLKYHLYPFVNNKGSFMGSFTIDVNKLFIKFEKNSYSTSVDTYLNAFGVSSNFDSDKNNTWLSKDFFCKTWVHSNGYINTDADFRIYNIFYFTTLSISSGSWDKNDKSKFDITIYEKSDDANNLRLRKIIIKGNNEEAMKYLKKNDIDYIDYPENETEKFIEEDFKPLK